MTRRRRKRSQQDVELNLAAMLDMAFQLLTFFILTFRSPALEGQMSLRLPPPRSVAIKPEAQPPGERKINVLPSGDSTLVIGAFAGPRGELAGLSLNEARVGGLGDLAAGLKKILADPDNPFDQVIVQVGSELHYDQLMKVMEVCAAQTLPDGRPLSKLSFVENPG